MAIYKMVGNKESLEEIPATSFGQEGVLERADLQRILRDKPEVLEDGLFVITEEFSNWEGSGRSIDLLCLDASGRLVVVELKRGDSGSHMDLQAIRYAAMVSTITLQQAIDAHQAYLNRLGIEEDAEERIREHLENNDDARFASERPRIILASEGFSQELTTCALWLNEAGLDVTCIRMQPHRSGSEVLVETSQIIPLPEAQDYLVRVREREEEQDRARQSSMGNFGSFVEGGALFRDRIDSVEGNARPLFLRLYDWATGLEMEKVAELNTYVHNERCNLLVGLPTGNNPNLVRVVMHRSALRFQTGYLEQYSPQAAQRLQDMLGQQILGRKSSFNIRLDNIKEEHLAALTEAYREANGLLNGNEEPAPPISDNS